MSDEVQKRRRGWTRVNSKNQVTLPAEALQRAGLRSGDELHVEADGNGRIVLVRDHDVIAKYAGSMADLYSPAYLETLRDEWH